MPLFSKYSAVSNRNSHFCSPGPLNTSSSDWAAVKGEDDEDVQVVTRPSEFVDAVKLGRDVVVEGDEDRSVRRTGMEDAGLPIEVSRTWHVIGGLGVGDAIAAVCVGFGESWRCWERA
jgi:hypothetical protein